MRRGSVSLESPRGTPVLLFQVRLFNVPPVWCPLGCSTAAPLLLPPPLCAQMQLAWKRLRLCGCPLRDNTAVEAGLGRKAGGDHTRRHIRHARVRGGEVGRAGEEGGIPTRQHMVGTPSLPSCILFPRRDPPGTPVQPRQAAISHGILLDPLPLGQSLLPVLLLQSSPRPPATHLDLRRRVQPTRRATVAADAHQEGLLTVRYGAPGTVVP